MEITSVEKIKKNKDRLSVYIDGKFAFNISEEDFISLHLYEEAQITQETIEYIKNTVNVREAKAKAVKYLALRIRTEKEVREKLHRDGYDQDCIQKVIEELMAIGYINDKLYAQKYIFDRSKLKPLSKKMMRLELISRGVSDEIADEVLSDWKVDDSVVAARLLKSKFGKYDLSDEKILRKAYMFLTHRGFSGETIKAAIREMKVRIDDEKF